MKNSITILRLLSIILMCCYANFAIAQKTKASPKATVRIKNTTNCEIANITFWLASPYTEKGILYESFGLSDDVVRANETFDLWRRRNTAVSSYSYTCFCEGQEGKFRRVEKYFSVRLGEVKTITISCN